jgi:UDP-N-acetylglucosamine/UDP-N-acetylgalactosamine diphosphorylase
MTSGPTRADTESFFKTNLYFGLPKETVHFFEQGVLPALTKEGKIILEDKDKVSVAPDGNGGVYAALRESKVLDDMQSKGVEYVHAYCVDNCLVRVADPVFLGFCLEKKAKCGAKVVRKVFAHEPVGVVCKIGGKFGVVEYSEIKKEDAEKRTPEGRFLFLLF